MTNKIVPVPKRNGVYQVGHQLVDTNLPNYGRKLKPDDYADLTRYLKHEKGKRLTALIATNTARYEWANEQIKHIQVIEDVLELTGEIFVLIQTGNMNAKTHTRLMTELTLRISEITNGGKLCSPQKKK